MCAMIAKLRMRWSSVMESPAASDDRSWTSRSPELLDLVPLARRLVASPIQQLERFRDVAPRCTLLEKLSRTQRRELLSDRYIDELVERRAVCLGNTFGLALQRGLQPEGIVRFGHTLASNHSRHAGPGRRTRNAKRSAPAKSRSLNVRSRSASPLTAVSRTSSSFGSRSIGRQRYEMITGLPI